MDSIYSIDFIKTLAKLFHDYDNCKEQLTPYEFVSKEVLEKDQDCFTERVASICLHMLRHGNFLKEVAKNFFKYYALKPTKRYHVIALLHCVIFIIDMQNYLEICTIFFAHQNEKSLEIVEYFMEEDNLVDVAQAACKIYCNDYVISNILHPLAAKNFCIETLHEELKYQILNSKPKLKPLTEPIGPSLLDRRLFKVPPPPANTPEREVKPFIHRRVPGCVYSGDRKIRRQLGKEYEQNRDNAMQLLEKARKHAFRCAVQGKLVAASIEEPPFKAFKAAKAPVKKEVDVKNNAAFVMRQAAALAKEEQGEIKKLEEIISGGCDTTRTAEFEKELRELNEREKIKEVEKKHLEGLICYEEAILAKKRVQNDNRERTKAFKEERRKMLQEVEAWKEMEQEKIKNIVEKIQSIPVAARKAEEKLLVQRQREVKLIEHEKSIRQRKALEAKQEELDRKAKLIHELRSLHQLRCLQNQAKKEFDPTECPNLGLLCEMSIAELQERLTMVKMEMKKELEERRKAVTEKKERQRRIVKEAKDFVEHVKDCRKKWGKEKSVIKVDLDENEEIAMLRDRLERAREMRLREISSDSCTCIDVCKCEYVFYS